MGFWGGYRLGFAWRFQFGFGLGFGVSFGFDLGLGLRFVLVLILGWVWVLCIIMLCNTIIVFIFKMCIYEFGLLRLGIYLLSFYFLAI